MMCLPASIGLNRTFAGAPSSDWAAEIAADSPYLWWRLGEASGTAAADASGNSRPGTYNGTAGAAYDLGEPSLVGDANAAIEIKSNNGWVRSNAQHAIANSGSGATLAVAIKINSGASAGAILTKHAASNPPDVSGLREPWLYLGSDGKLRAAFWSGSASIITSSMVVNDGVARLIHMRIGANGTEGTQLYVDGVLDGSVSAAPSLTYSGYITAGRNTISSGTWAGGADAAALGIYDEVVVFNSRLSPTRILAHAEAGGFA